MKKLIFILFLFCSILQAQTSWYISPSGNDGNLGTFASPFYTLTRACNEPELAEGDKIIVLSGSYTMAVQALLPDGVSIEGEGLGSTIIHTTVSGPLIKAESYNHWGDPSYGNQSISGITIDGDLTGTRAIEINFRSNVTIRDCRFVDMTDRGVIFYGSPEGAWNAVRPYYTSWTMPDEFSIGNKIYNCQFVNCARFVSLGVWTGALNIGQQDGFRGYNLTFDETARGGYGIKFYEDGFNKNIKIYDFTVIGAPRLQNEYNFGVELWNEITNNEYYNFVVQGGYDITHALPTSGTGYTSYIHDGVIGWDAVPDHTEAGLTLEGVVYDVRVEKVHFKNVTTGLSMQFIVPNDDNPYNSYMEDIKIRSNIFEIGITAGGWTYGQLSGIGFSEYKPSTNTGKRILIDNNTLICKGFGSRTNIYATAGIHYTAGGAIQGIKIRNNIFQGWQGGSSRNGFFLGESSASLDSLTFDNNLVYLCANSNDPTFYGGVSFGTHYDDNSDDLQGFVSLFLTNA